MSSRRDCAPRRLFLECLESRLALATLYVSPFGSDAQSGLANAPWQTLQKVADNVQPGDTVIVRPGSYVGFDLRRDGTAEQPIVFQADPGAAITRRNARTPDGINLEGADYITIEGFTISGMPRAGIRSVVNQHVTIRNNSADQNARWGIFTGFSDDLLIEGNKASRSQIEHGIYVSNSGDRPVIRNNIISGNRNSGIHMNGDASSGGDGIISGALVEGNVIFDNGLGGGSGINADGVQASRFQNNLLYNNSASGVSLYRIDGGGGSSSNIVVNNTIVQPAGSRWALNIQNGSTNNTILNNILYNHHSFRGSIDISGDSLPGFQSDYNVVMNRFTTDDSSSIVSLPVWQALAGQDLHSLVANPDQLFVDAAANDFELSTTSPALNAGTSQLAPAFDLSNASRPSGSVWDIGAFERIEVSDRGPTAHYRFEESSGTRLSDSSGNGNQALYVNQPALGQPGVGGTGTSVGFNGLDQYVALPAQPFGVYGGTGNYALTFETWFRAAPGSSGVILSQTGTGTIPGGANFDGYVPAVHLGTDGKIRSSLFWHADTQARLVSPGTTTYNDGQWHHVAVTLADGVQTLFLDGMASGQQSADEVPYASAYSYYLGTGHTALWEAGNEGWHYFAGQLDEAAIYQRALSAAEVAQHYALNDSAAALYHFDEALGMIATDSSGNCNQALYVNQPALGQPGVGGTGTSVGFNGLDQYVALPAQPFGVYGGTGNYALTFETWFRAAPGSSGVILSQTGTGTIPGGANFDGYVPAVHLGTDGKIRSSLFWHADTQARLVSPGNTIYNDGQWHHVAVTLADGVQTLFLDGMASGQQSADEVPNASAYSYYLGTGHTALWEAGNEGWHYFAGQLDEAAIYQRALSAAEVAQHYAAAAIQSIPAPDALLSAALPVSSTPKSGIRPASTLNANAVDILLGISFTKCCLAPAGYPFIAED